MYSLTQNSSSADQIHEILKSANDDNIEQVISSVVAICSQICQAEMPCSTQTRRRFFDLECRVEKDKATELIRDHANWTQFCFCADYKVLIEQEWALLAGHAEKRGKKPEDIRLVFLGSGAMPLSAMLLAQRLTQPVTCIDADAKANEIARDFLKSQNCLGRLSIQTSYAQTFDYNEVDYVLMASLIQQKQEVLSHLANFNIDAVLARTVNDGYKMIYDPIDETLAAEVGFRFADETLPNPSCMHQTLLMERAIPP